MGSLRFVLFSVILPLNGRVAQLVRAHGSHP